VKQNENALQYASTQIKDYYYSELETIEKNKIH